MEFRTCFWMNLIILMAVLSTSIVHCGVINISYKPNNEEVEAAATAPPTRATTQEPSVGIQAPTMESNSSPFCEMKKVDFKFRTSDCESNTTITLNVCIGLQKSFQVISGNGNSQLKSACVPTRTKVTQRKLWFSNCKGPNSRKMERTYLRVIKRCEVVNYPLYYR